MTPWLTVVWFVGTIGFCLRLVRSWWWVGKIRTRDNEPLGVEWLAKLDGLRQRLGISRPVRLLKSALVQVPTVIGWLRPVILLPASSLSGLSPQQLEAILAHELAHVRRLDYLINTFQCIVETLMFYHPVVWWISHQIREERENCCDDLVVEICGDRLIYARALTTLETLRVESPQLAFAATDGSLLHRIRRLFGTGTDNQPATLRQLSGLALVLIGSLMIATGIWLYLSPPRYAATSRIKIDPDPVEFSNTNGITPDPSSSYDPYFIQTQFEVLQSELVLNRTIDSLNLNENWGKKYGAGQPLKTGETVELLRHRLELRPVRSTSLIEIRAYSDNPEEAAAIANSIAESYKAHRLQVSKDLMAYGIGALEERLIEHEKKVEKAQAEVDRLQAELKILDSDPTAETVSELRIEVLLLKDTGIHQQRRLNALQKLTRADLREAMATALDVPDANLATLMNELDLAVQKVQVLQNQFTTNHPSYVNASRAIEDLNQKVDERVQKILLNLASNLETTRMRLAEKTPMYEAARSNDLRQAEISLPYYQAKKRLSELLQFRTVLGMKIASAQTEMVLPRQPMVTIVDRATATSHPVHPYRLSAVALIVVGLLLGLVGIRFLKRT